MSLESAAPELRQERPRTLLGKFWALLPILGALTVAAQAARTTSTSLPAARTEPEEHRVGALREILSLLLPVSAAFAVAFVVWFDNVHFFQPNWILHPDETGTLLISRQLAETGSFFLQDDWYLQSPGHIPDGVTLADGRIVPRKAPLGYLPYAAAFVFSEDGWRYVAPFFGFVAAVASGFLVFQKTRSRWAALAAAVALGASSPFMMYASGLAFVDMIALAFYLLGALAFHQFLRTQSLLAAFSVGLAMGAATLTRYDFLVAGLLALAVMLVHHRHHAGLETNLRRALPGIVPFVALCGLGGLANWWFYGSPFTTGYGSGSWQSSPTGVGSSLFDFSTLEFADLAWGYLLRIGFPCTLLFAAGLAIKAQLRRWDGSDWLLLGFAGFGVFYFLGKDGAYGTNESWLIGSYTRYLLPVYAAGVIVGVEGIFLGLRELRWTPLQISSGLLAVGIMSAAMGMHELYTNERGVAYVERVTLTHDVIRDVMERTPYPVVVSDLSTKAVVENYTITPRRLDNPEEIVTYVDREIRSRRHVLLVPQESHPLYTGYVESLTAAGYRLVVRRMNPKVYELELPVSESNASGEAQNGTVTRE